MEAGHAAAARGQRHATAAVQAHAADRSEGSGDLGIDARRTLDGLEVSGSPWRELWIVLHGVGSIPVTSHGIGIHVQYALVPWIGVMALGFVFGVVFTWDASRRRRACAWSGVASLALFAWLLSLHPAAAGRVYAAYGGVYIGVAILWLWAVDGIRPTAWDALGSAVALAGMAIIVFAPRGS